DRGHPLRPLSGADARHARTRDGRAGPHVPRLRNRRAGSRAGPCLAGARLNAAGKVRPGVAGSLHAIRNNEESRMSVRQTARRSAAALVLAAAAFAPPAAAQFIPPESLADLTDGIIGAVVNIATSQTLPLRNGIDMPE